MALFHFTVTQTKRSKGQSAIASAAYRSGEKLYSEYYGEYSDYTRKRGVICSDILLPPHAPKEYADRQTLWNAVEKAERGKNAQLAYSFEISLQNEFSLEENIALAREFLFREFVSRGMTVDVSFHEKECEDGGTPNPHFHFLCPIRPMEQDGTWGIKQRREYVLDEEGNRIRDANGKYVFNAVPTTDWGSPETLEHWREAWAEMCNAKFAEKGLDVRIDHRSYERQGVDLLPTIHEGATVRAMEKKGIRMEDIEPHLKAMSYGHKSNGLVEMNPELENGMRVSTKGRVSLEEQADGSLRVVPHYWQERPDLDAPFHGVLLDEEAKTNLMNTRHAGKVIDLELEPGKLTPCYVSIDKWTNTLEPMPVSLLEKRARIKEADLSEGKQMDFYGGGKVLLEGYTTRAGYKRDAYIQIDAAERNYSFTYDGLDRNRYAQENKEIYRQKAAEKNGRQETTASERQPTLTIHRTILKASVPKEAYDQWTEAVNDPSKRADVKAFYIKGMVKDGQGEPFNAWVKPNFERNKMDFFRWNPDRAKRQGGEIKPAVESRTQVAVNSEGKTVEAVKGVKEPLKQGQQEATPTQKKNYRSSKKSNSKGVKV